MRKNDSWKENFSPEVIKRLNLYLRHLRELESKGVRLVSSMEMSEFSGVSPVLFRKDLSYFGEFGKRGVGYNLLHLKEKLEQILGFSGDTEIALVGIGKLGSALLDYPGFSGYNLKITAAFDSDPAKIGRTVSGIRVADITGLQKTISLQKIKLGIICVPSVHAQTVAEKLVVSGIKAILNFAPVKLKLPADVFVSSVDMAVELRSLLYFIDNQNQDEIREIEE
ncbi:MAG: redox-sensing transcriptional repressor Rex [Candidatus Wallbacteria bacterium]|nr:redox-sensing transcriptional repressor Rex [Candidatus Wallbacteria bacterium]